MALPKLNKGNVPGVLDDLKNTHLSKEEIYIIKDNYIEYANIFFPGKEGEDSFTIYFFRNYSAHIFTIYKKNLLEKIELREVNVEALEDRMVNKNHLAYQQGESLYIRANKPIDLTRERGREQNFVIFPKMFFFKKELVFDEYDKIDFSKINLYFIMHALTKKHAHDMNRYYCVKNNNFKYLPKKIDREYASKKYIRAYN